ncbi:MAG: hypothetical protein F4Y37_08125 [Caldilineaceae bacterium SB0664_bin_22]|nr:hypothetical protein [Caldilineaceae bacterium SB0664_bin_22]
MSARPQPSKQCIESPAWLKPRRHLDVIKPDHADNRILECGLEASADYLVTGDRRHLLPLKKYRGTRIVNTPQFLSALAQ